jgi:hypothetical protein
MAAREFKNILKEEVWDHLSRTLAPGSGSEWPKQEEPLSYQSFR